MKLEPNKYRYYLIVDLEATCCNQGAVPREQMETIEIGAVMLAAESLESLEEFCSFVRPVRHPQLTYFCSQLTSITQAQVETASLYPEVISTFKNWLSSYADFVFCSWGDYDKTQLQRDSDYHHLPFPISAPHLNLKKQFSLAQHLPKKYGMDQALQMAGMELIGTHHRGIDDVRNMVRLMPYILGRKALAAKLETPKDKV